MANRLWFSHAPKTPWFLGMTISWLQLYDTYMRLSVKVSSDNHDQLDTSGKLTSRIKDNPSFVLNLTYADNVTQTRNLKK